MAEGYARVSGKPGVVLVTSGPGATNVVTPIQDALSDGVPLVVFCGQVPTSAIGSDAFQEADIIGITRGETDSFRKIFLSPLCFSPRGRPAHFNTRHHNADFKLQKLVPSGTQWSRMWLNCQKGC